LYVLADELSRCAGRRKVADYDPAAEEERHVSVEAEVTSALVAMTFHYDSQNISAFFDCWAEDARLKLSFIDGTTKELNGRSEIAELSKRGLEGGPSTLRHVVTSPSIQVDGDIARLDHHQLYIKIGETVELAGAGTYKDVWRRETDGKWRLAEREHVFLAPLPKR
jgi:ketosteroid isomerase-like protein